MKNKNIILIVVAMVLILLIYSLSYAVQNSWKPVWRGTDWIQSGRIISAKNIAENFEYLKREVDALSVGGAVECKNGQITMQTYDTKNVNCSRAKDPGPVVNCPTATNNMQVVYCKGPKKGSLPRNTALYQCINGSWEIIQGTYYKPRFTADCVGNLNIGGPEEGNW